jgi:hypothetical protein
MREVYGRKSAEEKRAMMLARDPEAVKTAEHRRYRRHREERLKRSREWVKANPERTAVIKRRWVENNPEKITAGSALRAAVRAGHIERGPCEVCGIQPAQGHHDDYLKPLEVRWLCPAHHAEHHAQERAAA